MVASPVLDRGGGGGGGGGAQMIDDIQYQFVPIW